MIPQIILLVFLAIGISRAFTERNQSPGHLAKFYDILLFYGVILALLYWGGFFENLISKL